jgi:hypothetical protein
MVVRLSALRTRRTLLPRNIIIFMFLVLISVRSWVNSRTYIVYICTVLSKCLANLQWEIHSISYLYGVIIANTDNEQICLLEVTISTCIREVIGSNLLQFSCYPGWTYFLWLSCVLTGNWRGVHGLSQWSWTFFCAHAPDVISLQLCTPRVVGV